MKKQRNNPYAHIQSFKDFEIEKMKLYYQLKFSEKKLELRYIELTSLMNPFKLVPALMSEWLSPVVTYLKNIIASYFHSPEAENNEQEKSDNQE